METVKFNLNFKVEVEVEANDAEVAEMWRYFRDNEIMAWLDMTSGFPVFTYECNLLNATIIFLSIRTIGMVAISNDRMNKEVAALGIDALPSWVKANGWYQDEDGQWIHSLS